MNKRRFPGDIEIKDVAKKLGMSDKQRELLFYGESGDGGAVPLQDITPSMAAATIRRFLTTGAIRWDRKE